MVGRGAREKHSRAHEASSGENQNQLFQNFSCRCFSKLFTQVLFQNLSRRCLQKRENNNTRLLHRSSTSVDDNVRHRLLDLSIQVNLRYFRLNLEALESRYTSKCMSQESASWGGFAENLGHICIKLHCI